MPSFKITRVGDNLSHGAVVITGESIRKVEGKKVARRGDLISCPLHGVQPIISTISTPVKTTGPQTSHIASTAACGAILITGSDLTKLDK
ncbi:MAG: PAAR domain-containing protein [Verrucomicrobiaceae bacterium]|nr:MAG: PAAR domain-containing protein [Verrucomicrobiaceae bacterium]